MAACRGVYLIRSNTLRETYAVRIMTGRAATDAFLSRMARFAALYFGRGTPRPRPSGIQDRTIAVRNNPCLHYIGASAMLPS